MGNIYIFTSQIGKGKRSKFKDYSVKATNFYAAVGKLKAKYPKINITSFYVSNNTEEPIFIK